jgi:hypothetical protein
MKQRLHILCVAILLATTSLKAQTKFGIGTAGSYNWIHGGIGAEFRAYIGLNSKMTIIPQFDYASLATTNVLVNEWFAGATFNYALFKLRNWKFEAIAGGFYNRWPNYQLYNSDMAQLNSVVAEVGGGIKNDNTCVIPFVEHRYNVKWKDATTRIGVYVMLVGCRGYNGGRPNGVLPCPRMSDF